MGHVRNYTLGDVVARSNARRDLMCCTRWDGMIRIARRTPRGTVKSPAKWTHENIDTMRAELKRMGLSIHWSREFATCDPTYYKHQQKLFLDFLKAGLAYRKESGSTGTRWIIPSSPMNR